MHGFIVNIMSDAQTALTLTLELEAYLVSDRGTGTPVTPLGG